jgi:hypothetical protein
MDSLVKIDNVYKHAETVLSVILSLCNVSLIALILITHLQKIIPIVVFVIVPLYLTHMLIGILTSVLIIVRWVSSMPLMLSVFVLVYVLKVSLWRTLLKNVSLTA